MACDGDCVAVRALVEICEAYEGRPEPHKNRGHRIAERALADIAVADDVVVCDGRDALDDRALRWSIWAPVAWGAVVAGVVWLVLI